MHDLKWGLASTIKAPARDVLQFAAYHLEAGAHRLYIYLDEPNPLAYDALKAHPNCRVTTCDAAWWDKNGKRPRKHQVRQTVNATHAYHRKAEVDWLIHMDADEFLVAQTSVALHLEAVPKDQQIARIRPMEQLAGDGDTFKRFVPNGPGRAGIVRDLYPTYGQYVKGGFLSHLAGKVFVRTGLEDMRVQIHNVFQRDKAIGGTEQLDGIDLAHCHAKSWEDWHAAYRYRLEKGSYRAELAPNKPREQGGLSMHELFEMIEAQDGPQGLRAFFDEVCADTPVLRARLRAHGLLSTAQLNLDQAVATHFPDVSL